MRVIVVGAGMGGLASAIQIAAAGHEVVVLERSHEIGGMVATLDLDGYRFDLGPTSITCPAMLDEPFRSAGTRSHRRGRADSARPPDAASLDRRLDAHRPRRRSRLAQPARALLARFECGVDPARGARGDDLERGQRALGRYRWFTDRCVGAVAGEWSRRPPERREGRRFVPHRPASPPTPRSVRDRDRRHIDVGAGHRALAAARRAGLRLLARDRWRRCGTRRARTRRTRCGRRRAVQHRGRVDRDGRRARSSASVSPTAASRTLTPWWLESTRRIW